MSKKMFIVGEISRNWIQAESIDAHMAQMQSALLSEKFEDMINVNFHRGYKLYSWRLDRLVTSVYTESNPPLAIPAINETIIAVFTRMPPPLEKPL